MADLSGKVTVVTGGGSGIGKEICRFFARAGATIVIPDINLEDAEGTAEIVEELKSKGVKVVTATHALAGIDRAVRKKHGTWMTTELIAETLRMFGQGTKVCAEIVLMAADAGAIKMENLIAIGGTGRGADTAWVITPAHSHTFFSMKLKELICKP